jgi:hypothetical protein
MHKFKMRSKHLINKSINQINLDGHPPPTLMNRRCLHRPSLAPFRRKKDLAIEGGLDPPQWPGERDPVTPGGHFCLRRNKKKLWRTKKKKRTDHWGWPRSTPTARGREIRPPPVAIFVSPVKKKKRNPATQTQPKKSFLMPQKSILMLQNSFLMPQN